MSYSNKEIHNASLAILLKTIMDAKDKDEGSKAVMLMGSYIGSYLDFLKEKESLAVGSELWNLCKQHINQRIKDKS